MNRFARIAALVLFVSAPFWALSCGDDDEPEGVCTEGSNEGCAPGQQCLPGPDGATACYCDANAGSGCPEGLECQAVNGGQPDCFCSPGYQTGCEDGLVCEEVQDGNSACYPPVTVRGMVFDLTTDAAVEGAHVVARDANNVAVSDVAVTDVNGNYELAVPTRRDAEGGLLETNVSLRADAEGYLAFPKPPRVALPFDTAQASGDPLVLETSATDIGLLPLDDTTGLGTITGTVLAEHPRGTLVVAGGSPNSGGGVTGIADYDGTYTVFNVPAGSVPVRGYAAGLQFDSTTADVVAGQTTADVDLGYLGAATAVVTGKIEIVNPGDGDDTSVILVVDETFDDAIASGETPPGLRAYPVDGDFSIPDVPDGNYVVLAAFENDFLVRDPDQSIGGTSIVRISVSGASVDMPESFKVTGALDVVSPDAEEVVSGTPTFIWGDDSSEVRYEVQVYDAYGTLVWEDLNVPSVSGSSTVEVSYGGDPLEAGMLYQFRATSIKNNGSPIAR
ncbi:MAG: carboxypeptidase regulatory-like domain-containing protein, partial [Deltaproteobacteria bacterium]|nr:carboxypeptidase regulatory-like domain-containing protein [Deltaproteobacteria bacterium]MBW2533111.1 carboxypeptidase regulatory-like domain-containing protein [Deltaproteobacteria bacterium]